MTPTRVFIAMELVVGRNLREWLGAPRTVQAIVDVMRQVGQGIAAAHRAGIVHRDVKPENVLVGDDGRVRVVDFGLARATATRVDDDAPVTATHTGTIAGTPAYMAPELFEARPRARPRISSRSARRCGKRCMRFGRTGELRRRAAEAHARPLPDPPRKPACLGRSCARSNAAVARSGGAVRVDGGGHRRARSCTLAPPPRDRGARRHRRPRCGAG